jgi:hypothetical protein
VWRMRDSWAGRRNRIIHRRKSRVISRDPRFAHSPLRCAKLKLTTTSLCSDYPSAISHSLPIGPRRVSFAQPSTTAVVEITPVNSTIKFNVKASTSIAGKFDNWDATTRTNLLAEGHSIYQDRRPCGRKFPPQVEASQRASAFS